MATRETQICLSVEYNCSLKAPKAAFIRRIENGLSYLKHDCELSFQQAGILTMEAAVRKTSLLGCLLAETTSKCCKP
jgi:hypothetical protein